MKIGLVRHFRVKKDFPKQFLVNYTELVKWFEEYDYTDIEVVSSENNFKNNRWEICYCSPALRARITAQQLYDNEPTILEELNELNVLSLLNKRLKLPFILWGIIIRNKSLAKNEITLKFQHQIKIFLDKIIMDKAKQVLIVSHGLVMMHLQKELRSRGFKGQGFNIPQNGQLYVFEK